MFRGGLGDVYSVDLHSGKVVRETKTGFVGDYALSPNGDSMAICDVQKQPGLWSLRSRWWILRGSVRRDGRHPVDLGSRISPSWTQQGAALVMATSAWGVDFASGSGIYVVDADGSGLSLVPGVNGAFTRPGGRSRDQGSEGLPPCEGSGPLPRPATVSGTAPARPRARPPRRRRPL